MSEPRYGLRKRSAPQPAPSPPLAKKAANKVAKAAANKVAKAAPKVKEDVAPKAAKSAAAPAAKAGAKPSPGDVITLDGFGGEVETNEGKKTSLKALVEESKAGVVLFTYPKASTPGCTNQVCLFRDSYTPLTRTGLAIYGLSGDSPKANTTFREKQKLPYPLLCDTVGTLITAIGMRKTPKGTQRGVFVVDKQGKVLAAEPGGPAATVDVVKRLVDEHGLEEVGDEAEESKDEPAVNGNGTKKEAEEEAKDEAKDEEEAKGDEEAKE